MMVSTKPPYQVLDFTDEEKFEVLGYDTKDLIGQSVMRLLGPLSDLAMFQHAIEAVTQFQVTKIQLILYDKYGDDRQSIVSCYPSQTVGHDMCCSVTIEPCQAITLSEVFTESSCPHVLVSTEAPNFVQMCNSLFNQKFGLHPNSLVGQPLPIFHPADAEKWTALLSTALQGQISRDRLRLNNPFCSEEDTILVPVVEGPNGRIKHALVLFAPPAPPPRFPPAHGPYAPGDGYAPDPGPAFPPHYPPAAFPPAEEACVPPEPFALSPTAAGGHHASYFDTMASARPPAESPTPPPPAPGPRRRSSPLSGSPLAAAGPVIYPRRKAAAAAPDDGAAARPVPVVVTPELLRALDGLPLVRAAEAVGVSPTALKKACRKLGVGRWAYRRGSPPRSAPPPPSGSLARGIPPAAAEDAAAAAAAPGAPPPGAPRAAAEEGAAGSDLPVWDFWEDGAEAAADGGESGADGGEGEGGPGVEIFRPEAGAGSDSDREDMFTALFLSAPSAR